MNLLNLHHLADARVVITKHDLLLQHLKHGTRLVAMLQKVIFLVGHIWRSLTIEAVLGVRHPQWIESRSCLATRHDDRRSQWLDIQLTLKPGRDRSGGVLWA